jgi:hypothetical protein
MPTTSLLRPRSLRDPQAAPASVQVMRASRAGVVLLLVLAVANGVFLYLVPARAEADYAWAIRPPINAAFLGAGYLAGTLATALVVWAAQSWRSLRILPLPLVMLSVTLLAATLVHADRFRWDYAPTWVWTGVYAVVPALVALLWVRQERGSGSQPAADPRLRRLRALSAVLGGVMAAGAIALFAAPGALADLWPWPLTPLLGRAVASWYLLVGTALLTAAVSLRRPHEVLIPYATLLAWTALLLLLPILHADDLAGGSASLPLWVLLQALLLALAVYGLARSVPLMRAEGERL